MLAPRAPGRLPQGACGAPPSPPAAADLAARRQAGGGSGPASNAGRPARSLLLGGTIGAAAASAAARPSRGRRSQAANSTARKDAIGGSGAPVYTCPKCGEQCANWTKMWKHFQDTDCYDVTGWTMDPLEDTRTKGLLRQCRTRANGSPAPEPSSPPSPAPAPGSLPPLPRLPSGPAVEEELEAPGPFACPECGKVAKRWSDMWQHLNATDCVDVAGWAPDPRADARTKVLQRKCSEFASMTPVQSGPFACTECGFKRARWRDLWHHLTTTDCVDVEGWDMNPLKDSRTMKLQGLCKAKATGGVVRGAVAAATSSIAASSEAKEEEERAGPLDGAFFTHVEGKRSQRHVTSESMEAGAARLLEHRLVAVHVEGQLSRTGQIDLIVITAEKERVHLFDWQALSAAADEGHPPKVPTALKDLLQTKETVKLLHDCRAASNALFHLLGVRLDRVVDTQVLYALLHPMHPRRGSLEEVLQEYADQEPEPREDFDLARSLSLCSSGDGDGDGDGHPGDVGSPEQELAMTQLFRHGGTVVEGLLAAVPMMCKKLPMKDVGADVRKWSERQLAAYRDQEGDPLDCLRPGQRMPFRVSSEGHIVLEDPNGESTAAEAELDETDDGFEEDERKFLEVLPLELAASVRPHMDGLVDLVLDLHKQPIVRLKDKEMGRLVERDLEDSPVVTEDLLSIICAQISAFDDQQRAGIEGTLSRISRIRRGHRTVGLTMRFAAAAAGTLQLLQDVAASGKSVLLLGGPGVGKTTILRRFAEDRSKTYTVMIVEASKEIAGPGDACHPSVGRSRRLLAEGGREGRGAAMIEAVENHTPRCLVIDEIGTNREAQMARTIAARGVQIIGTAHGKNISDLLRNGELNGLLGGTQQVILANADERYNGRNKLVLERRGAPVFDVLVEVHSPGSVKVYWDVRMAVDNLLAGERPEAQLRQVDPDTGRLFLTKVRTGSCAVRF